MWRYSTSARPSPSPPRARPARFRLDRVALTRCDTQSWQAGRTARLVLYSCVTGAVVAFRGQRLDGVAANAHIGTDIPDWAADIPAEIPTELHNAAVSYVGGVIKHPGCLQISGKAWRVIR